MTARLFAPRVTLLLATISLGLTSTAQAACDEVARLSGASRVPVVGDCASAPAMHAGDRASVPPESGLRYRTRVNDVPHDVICFHRGAAPLTTQMSPLAAGHTVWSLVPEGASDCAWDELGAFGCPSVPAFSCDAWPVAQRRTGAELLSPIAAAPVRPAEGRLPSKPSAFGGELLREWQGEGVRATVAAHLSGGAPHPLAGLVWLQAAANEEGVANALRAASPAVRESLGHAPAAFLARRSSCGTLADQFPPARLTTERSGLVLAWVARDALCAGQPGAALDAAARLQWTVAPDSFLGVVLVDRALRADPSLAEAWDAVVAEKPMFRSEVLASFRGRVTAEGEQAAVAHWAERHPDDPTAWLWLARTAAEAGDRAVAERALAAAREILPAMIDPALQAPLPQAGPAAQHWPF